MVVGIGVIAGVECVIMGNDPTVLGGALTPYAGKKWMRAIEIARDNRIPYVSFVESAGADLRMGGGGERRPEDPDDHFAETGRFFYEMIELSKLRIPSVCVVFGSSTAGGAYQPGLSDYNDRGQGAVEDLPGRPAAGEDGHRRGFRRRDARRRARCTPRCRDSATTSPRTRWTPSACAARWCRTSTGARPGPQPACAPTTPVHDPEELLGLVEPRPAPARRRPRRDRPRRRRLALRGVQAPLRPHDGLRLGDRSTATRSASSATTASSIPTPPQKAAHFIQLCNQIDVPLVFLQNITGFMVGRDFEADGIIKKGSQMINAVTNSTVPHLTVIIGSSYGAGTYGMSGRAFGNRFTFLWPTAKIAVMGPKQIAGVMSIVRRGQAARKGIAFDEEEDARDRGHGRSSPGEGLARPRRHRRDQRRRHHRPPRHPHRARHVPVGGPQPPDRGRRGLRGVPAVSRPITSVLVANRGEIARRIIRTARAMGIRSVAVYVDADADAPVRRARPTRPCASPTAATSTASSIIAAARPTGADAIHPGYGFLSENAAFAARGRPRPASSGSARRPR